MILIVIPLNYSEQLSLGKVQKPLSNCFASGTKITMWDGTLKNIEEVKIGDIAKSADPKTHEVSNANVYKIVSVIHDSLIKISFAGDISNTNTSDHPYYVYGKGWCSFKPQLTKKRYNLNTLQLRVGDMVYQFKNDGYGIRPIKILSITQLYNNAEQTYNIYVEGNENYFANGILVNDEIIKPIEQEHPDKAIIYSLDPFSEYSVAVYCDKIKTYSMGLDVTSIKDTAEINEMYSVLHDSHNFTLDSLVDKIDTRTQIDFLNNGRIIYSVCWEPKLMEKEGLVYKYNKKVVDFLRKYKTIGMHRIDTTRYREH